jgi:hypothetical protein
MNTSHDEKWQRLLAASAPTFAGEATPPYGFITSTLGRLRGERGQVEEIERIGWRALLASLVATVAVAAIAFGLTLENKSTDFDPGDRSLIQVENISVS